MKFVMIETSNRGMVAINPEKILSIFQETSPRRGQTGLNGCVIVRIIDEMNYKTKFTTVADAADYIEKSLSHGANYPPGLARKSNYNTRLGEVKL